MPEDGRESKNRRQGGRFAANDPSIRRERAVTTSNFSRQDPTPRREKVVATAVFCRFVADREWGEKPEIFFFGSWGLRVRFLVSASRQNPAFPRYGRTPLRSSTYRKNIEGRIA
jgi:hypothetical protein